MSDYKPCNIDLLAKAIYRKQSDFVGADHAGYCVTELKLVLQSFEDRIATDADALEQAQNVAEMLETDRDMLRNTVSLQENLLDMHSERIEQLEAALRKIAITQYYRDDDLGEHMRIAEEALETEQLSGE